MAEVDAIAVRVGCRLWRGTWRFRDISRGLCTKHYQRGPARLGSRRKILLISRGQLVSLDSSDLILVGMYKFQPQSKNAICILPANRRAAFYV